MAAERSPRRARRVLTSVAFAVVAAGTAAWLFYEPSKPEPATPEDQRTPAWVAPVSDIPADLTGGFILSVGESDNGNVRQLELRSGDADATLRLAAATDYAGDEASGRAILSTADRLAGARFVSALARWVGASTVVTRTAPPGKLPPLVGSYVHLPKSEGWEHYRLLFIHGSSRAELLLDLSPRGDRARLIDTGNASREGTIAFLIAGLRDGFKRRTDLAPGLPLWSDFQPLGGTTDATVQAWPTNAGAWGAENNGRTSTIVWWSRLDRPPAEIAKVNGVVTTLAPSRQSRKAALVIVHPSRDYPPGTIGYAANDPTQLVIVDASQGAPLPVSIPGHAVDLRPQILWSPLGTSIALDSVDPKTRKHAVRIIDVSNEREIAVSQATDKNMLLEWTNEGLIFASGSPTQGLTLYRWLPARGAPMKLKDDEDRVSPDGTCRFRLVDGALQVSGPGGIVPIPVVYQDVRDALDYAIEVQPWWLGGHRLLIVADDLLALDLKTGGFRYLFPQGRTLLLQGTSPDGRMVIARDETDRLVWAHADVGK